MIKLLIINGERASAGCDITFCERRERELQELVKKGKRPVALFVDEAHDLNDHTLSG
jgi:type II secretory pathway predicted ATPase ExeA